MSLKLSGRALHWVFKVGDRAKTIDFYRNVLGMKVSGRDGNITATWKVLGRIRAGNVDDSLGDSIFGPVGGERHMKV